MEDVFEEIVEISQATDVKQKSGAWKVFAIENVSWKLFGI